MLVLKVTFRGSSLKEFAQHYLTDLSQTGMFVRTQSPLPVGTKIRFEFRLENDIPLLFGQGIVFWVSEENRELKIPCGMELRFDSLSPESENHFQWLQLEKRGVTVGTEVPLYITTTTTASDPTGVSGKDSADAAPVGRSSPSGERPTGTGTLQGLKPPLAEPEGRGRERAPTGPAQAIRTERAPTGPQRSLAATLPTGSPSPRTETDPDGRATLPYLRKEDEPTPAPGSRLPVLASPPRVEEGLTGYRPPAHLKPGDSDPAKMFSQVAPRSASLSGSQLEGHAGRDTLLTVHELTGRRLRLGGIVLVGAGLVALLFWWFARAPAPSPAGPGSAVATVRLVRIASDPVNAEVVIGGKLAGRTPLELPVADEPMLQIRHAGFLPEVIKISTLDPRWRTEGGRQVLEVSVTLARAAAPVPDASPQRAASPDAAPERRRRRARLEPEGRPAAKRVPPPDEPRLAPEPEAKKPEPESKKPEPEAKKPESKKPEPESKKPEPESKKPAVKTPAVKTPDGAPEGKQEKKVKAPIWAD